MGDTLYGLRLTLSKRLVLATAAVAAFVVPLAAGAINRATLTAEQAQNVTPGRPFVDPEARFDRQAFRRLYEAPGVRVRDVSAFRRHGRRFAHVRLEVADIAQLQDLVPLSWSRYRLERLENEFRFVQEVGPAAQLQIADVGWTGNELVAFRVHLPSRINFHNSPLDVERGNILVWEQTLRDRLAGTKVVLTVVGGRVVFERK